MSQRARIGAFLFLASVLVVSLCIVGFADEAISTDVVLTILETREDQLKNASIQGKFIYEWEWISENVPFESLFPGPRKENEIRFPPHRYYLIDYARDGEKVFCSQKVYWPSQPSIEDSTPPQKQLACTFDGDALITYDNDYTSITIRKDLTCLKSYAGFVKLESFGFSAWRLPLSEWLRIAASNGVPVTSDTMRMDGKEYTTVHWVHDSESSTSALLVLDNSKGYAVTKVSVSDSSEKTLWNFSALEMREFDNGFWFPIRATVTSADEHIVFEAVEMTLNQPIPESVFAMRPAPAGAFIFDESLGTSFIVPQ